MTAFYAKDNKIFAKKYLEIYIPQDYFKKEVAINRGTTIETLGILFINTFNTDETKIQILNIPTIVELNLYDSVEEEIKISGNHIPVTTLRYIKDSAILIQSIERGKDVASGFLNSVLSGKLPKNIDYSKLLNMWWKNIEIAGINLNVPSSILEMIFANIYRNPKNFKERYGMMYGKQTNPTGTDYVTGNTREVVGSLSSFSGIIFEDINSAISTGIINSIENIEEPVSPLEKIIHY